MIMETLSGFRHRKARLAPFHSVGVRARSGKTTRIGTGLERGQAAVEFAMSMLVFLLLTIGMIETSLAVYYYNSVRTAASEAARFIMAHGPQSPYPATNAQILSVIQNATQGLDQDNIKYSVSYPADPNFTAVMNAQDVQVTVEYQFAADITGRLYGNSQTNNMHVESTAQYLLSPIASSSCLVNCPAY